MIHPLFMRLTTQPGLFAEHAGAYAELAVAEAGVLEQRWVRRAVFALVALASALLALVLVGVAILIAAALPFNGMPAPWGLWLVPALPALLAAACAWAARSSPSDAGFTQLRRQFDADIELLREVDAA